MRLILSYAILLTSFLSHGQDKKPNIDSSKLVLFSTVKEYYDPLIKHRIPERGFELRVDSAKCFNCIDKDGNSIAYYSIHKVRIGEWKTFHLNGQVKSTGSYNGSIHISYDYNNYDYLKVTIDSPAVTRIEFLKNGIWKEFDQHGKLIKIEEYIEGRVVRILLQKEPKLIELNNDLPTKPKQH